MKANDFIILPYKEVDGYWTLRDSEMSDLYQRMVNENSLKRVFYEGNIPNKSEFVRYFKDPDVLAIGAWNVQKVPIILIWVTSIINKRGFIHFCTFAGSFGRKKIMAARAILEILMKQFECLIGITPAPLTDAIHLARLAGMKCCGYVPSMFPWPDGKRVGAHISYIERKV